MEKRMKGRHASFIAHHSSRVTRHGFCYRSPMEYLTSKGFIPETLAEIDLESGSVSGTQARGLSGRLWKMERGELETYWRLHCKGKISLSTFCALAMFSLAKYARRMAKSWLWKFIR